MPEPEKEKSEKELKISAVYDMGVSDEDGTEYLAQTGGTAPLPGNLELDYEELEKLGNPEKIHATLIIKPE